MSKVAVIGAGVLGSVIGWRLAGAGHQVRIFDLTPAGQASAGSLAWLNASFAEDPVYNRLRHESLQLWAGLKADNPDLPIEFDGAILWQQPHFDLSAIHQAQRDLGRPVTRLDRAAHKMREPDVPNPPTETLALEGDGYGWPARICEWFLDSAKAAGAELVGLDVVSVETGDGRVSGLRSTAGFERFDHVVIAAGVKLPDLLGPLGLGIAMDNQPGLLVTTSPADAKIGAMLATDGLHGWQGADGRFLIGADFGGGAAFEDPDDFAAALVARLGDVIPGAKGCGVERVTVRARPMPADGRPAIGPLGPEGLYMVCTHSGMTLAPVIGEMVAAEISGTPDPRLDPYRPDRASLQT